MATKKVEEPKAKEVLEIKKVEKPKTKKILCVKFLVPYKNGSIFHKGKSIDVHINDVLEDVNGPTLRQIKSDVGESYIEIGFRNVDS